MRKDSQKNSAKFAIEHRDIPAGCFTSWLRRTRSLMIKENGSVVNCGSCNVCCTSSYFIHIRPEETRTLSKINKNLLFPAPGLPKGNLLMGHFQNGKCPMMVNNRCSIYAYRPLTCRIYDCRIFAAARILAGDENQAQINQRIKNWKFSYPTPSDRAAHSAVQAAAAFIMDHADCFPNESVPTNPSQLAILALKVYTVFLGDSPARSNPEIAKAIMEANERFESRRITYGAQSEH